MNFSRLKYLALGMALWANSAHANAIEQPDLGRIVKKAEGIDYGTCSFNFPFVAYISLKRADGTGNTIGRSYHLIKRGNEYTLMNISFSKRLSEGKIDQLIGEFEVFPFALATETKIYTNENPRYSFILTNLSPSFLNLYIIPCIGKTKTPPSFNWSLNS